MLPFATVQAMISTLMMKKDKNMLKSNKPLTGSKKAAFSNDYSVEQVKKFSKQKGVTINDVLMAITSISLKEYMISKGDLKSSRIQMAMPYSMDDPPESKEHIKLNNKFAILNIPLELYDDLDQGLRPIKKEMEAFKHSLVPFGML